MKIRSILNCLAFSLVTCSVAVTSCKEPEPEKVITPEFPALVEKYDLAPGSTVTLTFDVNMDWTLSVPTNTLKWFWIDDNSFQVDKVSGKVEAGQKETVTVNIGVYEGDEFENLSCEVTLAMGGESKVIAKYMRPAKDRTIEVYTALFEEGSFTGNEEDGYSYSSEKASAASLVWSAEDKDFRMPLRVEANCNWDVELPEWLSTNVPSGSLVGLVDIILTGSSLDDKSGKIVFKVKDGADKGQVIKEIDVTLPSCREVSVKAVQVDENNEFIFSETGSGYLYTEESISDVSLIWTGSDFRLPMLVDSKCDWTLEGPDWLKTEIGEETAGVLEFNLQAIPSEYPLEDASAKVALVYEGEKIYEFNLTIPGCRDLAYHTIDMQLSELHFNYLGGLKTATGYIDVDATGSIFGARDMSVFAVEIVDGRFVNSSSDPEWLQIEVTGFDTADGADVMQERDINISVKNNDGVERKAYVFFNNGNDWDDRSILFNEAGDAVKDEFMQFAVPVVQYGKDMPYITMSSTEAKMQSAGVVFSEVTGSKKKRYQNSFGQTDHVYSLTYNNVYARDEAFMFFAVPYADYKIFDADRTTEIGKDNDSFWLSLTELSETLSYGVLEMYKNIEEIPSAPSTGFVVFYDAEGKPLAIIEAIYDSSIVIESDVKIELIGESAMYAEMLGTTLVEVTAESDKDLYDIYKEYMAPIYHLTYRMTGMPFRISIPANAVMYTPNPYAKRNQFVINGLDYDETVGKFDLLEGGVDVYMFPPEDSDSDWERGNILFYDSDNIVVLVLVCTLDLTE